MPQTMQFVDEHATRYPTAIDVLKAFDEEMRSLYLLAFLLTADHDMAEKCLISAMGECGEGIGVFSDWVRSWSRRTVLKRAIQMIKPAPDHADKVYLSDLKQSATPAEHNPFASILSLDAFERFVFVMSILEGHSDAECAVLLRCSRRDVIMARALAVKLQSSPHDLTGEILQS